MAREGEIDSEVIDGLALQTPTDWSLYLRFLMFTVQLALPLVLRVENVLLEGLHGGVIQTISCVDKAFRYIVIHKSTHLVGKYGLFGQMLRPDCVVIAQIDLRMI